MGIGFCLALSCSANGAGLGSFTGCICPAVILAGSNFNIDVVAISLAGQSGQTDLFALCTGNGVSCALTGIGCSKIAVNKISGRIGHLNGDRLGSGRNSDLDLVSSSCHHAAATGLACTQISDFQSLAVNGQSERVADRVGLNLSSGTFDCIGIHFRNTGRIHFSNAGNLHHADGSNNGSFDGSKLLSLQVIGLFHQSTLCGNTVEASLIQSQFYLTVLIRVLAQHGVTAVTIGQSDLHACQSSTFIVYQRQDEFLTSISTLFQHMEAAVLVKVIGCILVNRCHQIVTVTDGIGVDIGGDGLMVHKKADVGSFHIPQLGHRAILRSITLAVDGMGCIQCFVHRQLAVLVDVGHGDFFVSHAQLAPVADCHINSCILGRLYLGFYITAAVTGMACFKCTALFSTGNKGAAFTGMARTKGTAFRDTGSCFLRLRLCGKGLNGYITHQHHNRHQHCNDSLQHTNSSIYFRKCISQSIRTVIYDFGSQDLYLHLEPGGTSVSSMPPIGQSVALMRVKAV